MLLVVVAIERVRTMQLLVWEAFVMAYKSYACFPQMALTNDAINITTCTAKRENLIESTGVVPAEYPPKVKLELFSQL